MTKVTEASAKSSIRQPATKNTIYVLRPQPI